MGAFLFVIVKGLDLVLSLFMWTVIIRAILSWVSPASRHPIAHMLYRITEPILSPIRSRLPWHWGIDLSPMIVIIIILFLRNFLVVTLLDWAR